MVPVQSVKVSSFLRIHTIKKQNNNSCQLLLNDESYAISITKSVSSTSILTLSDAGSAVS